MIRLTLFWRSSVLGLCITVCSCSWPGLDHPTNANLQQELLEKSKNGLALIIPGQQTRPLELRFFDGAMTNWAAACCARTEAERVSRNRLLMMDLSSSPILDTQKAFKEPRAFAADVMNYGGPLVVLNERGDLLARSLLRVTAGIAAVSPGEQSFAFIGVPTGHLNSDFGLYIGTFNQLSARRIRVLDSSKDPDVMGAWSVDWSPGGESVLLSDHGVISLTNADTGETRKLVDGGYGRWSPNSDWISFRTPDLNPALLNTKSGESHVIDTRHGATSPIEWSPDGKYLLIVEAVGSHVPYGCLWVYRIADAAWVPIEDYGNTNPHPFWIQTGP